jgi:hypothetical protein
MHEPSHLFLGNQGLHPTGAPLAVRDKLGMRKLPEFQLVDSRQSNHRLEPDLLFSRRLDLLVELVVHVRQSGYLMLREPKMLPQHAQSALQLANVHHPTSIVSGAAL